MNLHAGPRSLILLAATFLAPHVVAAEAAPVRALLELRNREFFYAGEPFPVRISILNDGEQAAPNPVRGPLLGHFEVRTLDGAAIAPARAPEGSEPQRPETLGPKERYFAVTDLTKSFPQLLAQGVYVIAWSADGLRSDTFTVHMIPKYDPAKEYEARIETSEGTFRIEFFPKTAPIAVKAFIDMSNAGFYDGLAFHKAVADAYVEGGDPAADGSGRPPFTYPAEVSGVSALAGSVLMKPVGPSPPSNGCQFMVLLRPESSLTGQATILGQVIEGLDVVRRISQVPTTQMAERPHFKPLRNVSIRKITVAEKKPPTRP